MLENRTLADSMFDNIFNFTNIFANDENLENKSKENMSWFDNIEQIISTLRKLWKQFPNSQKYTYVIFLDFENFSVWFFENIVFDDGVVFVLGFQQTG